MLSDAERMLNDCREIALKDFTRAAELMDLVSALRPYEQLVKNMKSAYNADMGNDQWYRNPKQQDNFERYKESKKSVREYDNIEEILKGNEVLLNLWTRIKEMPIEDTRTPTTS